MNSVSASRPAATGSLDDLHYLSLTSVSALIRSGEVSPVEVTAAILARIEALDGALLSYFAVLADRALAAARVAEAEIAAGEWRGPLHGVPVAVKDLFKTSYAPTSNGMFINREHRSSETATAVSRLEQAGAIMLGKLNMTEGAMSGHHPRMKTPINPWSARLWTGNSSSGPGVATAAGLCYGALGSETGGSIRLPTAANGLVGLKPSFGRVSRYGVFSLADSLDHVGPMTRTVADAAVMLGAIAGHDRLDVTASDAPVPDYLAMLGGSIAGLRIGIDEHFAYNDVDAPVAATLRAAIETFEALGARIVPVRFPEVDGAFTCWQRITSTECAIAHADTYPSRRDEYGPLADFLDMGRNVTGLQLAEAVQYRLQLTGAINRAMLDCDALLLPGLPRVVKDATFWADPANGAEAADLARFTQIFCLSGHPALSFNGGFDTRGAPIGLQLIGERFDEGALFQLGYAFQTATSWHHRHPVLPEEPASQP